MKVEEIKLALEKNKETHLQFNISKDIEDFLDKGNKSMQEYNDLQKQAELKAKLAENAAKQALALSQKAIAQAKDLGVETSFFDGRLNMAKDLDSRSKKAKAIIL